MITYFPLFLIFPLYRVYRERKRRLDDVLLAYRDPNKCTCRDGEYSVVVSMGNEEKTIKENLEAVLNQSLKPLEVHLFVEAKDRTMNVILEVLSKYGYRKVNNHVVREYLDEKEWYWDKNLEVVIYTYENSEGVLPRVIIYESRGDVLGKGLSINWLVKRGYVKTPFFLQLDADAIPEPDLAKKLLCSVKQDERIAGVYAFSYEVAEDGGLQAKIVADYGYNVFKRMSHVIFRESWNYLEFCVTMEGLHIMFRTDVYRKIPRPMDTLAGDMAHSWELQSAGYLVLENIYARSYVREISSFKGLVKQRLKWNSGPIQNLYRRGISTLRRVRNKVRAGFAILYQSIVSPAYQSFWLVGPFILYLLGLWDAHFVLRFYLIDFTIHLGAAIYSTKYLSRIYEEFRVEKWYEFLVKFLSFYFVFRLPISLMYLYVYPKNILEILYHHLVKREKEKKKWFLLT